jgi:predicted porin
MKSLFKLSTLAVSVFAASQVSAIELYNNEGTEASMYGVIGAHVASYGYSKDTILGADLIDFTGGDTAPGFGFNDDALKLEDPGSFLGFDIKHSMGDYYALVKLEWDVNFDTAGDLDDEALATRQTYVGIGHSSFGTVSIGRQESPYMKTDKGYYSWWTGGFNQGFSDELGSRRAINTVQWQKDFDNLYIGLQYQAQRNVDAIGLGNSLSYGNFFVPANDGEQISIKDGFGAGIAYTFEQTGTYLAAAYNQANNINGDVIDFLGDFSTIKLRDTEFKQYALAVEQHFMEGGLSVSARYEHLEAKNGSLGTAFESKSDNFGIGANMYISESVRIYANYEMGNNKEKDGSTNSEFDMFALGAAWAPVAWAEVYLEGYSDDVKLNNSYTLDDNGLIIGTGASAKSTNIFLGAAVFF